MKTDFPLANNSGTDESNHLPTSIVLASASPRRKELLKGLGLNFRIHPSSVVEDFDPSWSPEELVQKLAQQKASDVAQYYDQGLILGADTIVVIDQNVLGKPKDEEEARQMLKQLQGNIHTVYSGVTLLDLNQQIEKTGFRSTKVKLRPLSDAELKKYIATKEPMDKAGAYAIQGIGATLVDQIEGDYFTVVGLPLSMTSQFLKECGVDILAL